MLRPLSIFCLVCYVLLLCTLPVCSRAQGEKAYKKAEKAIGKEDYEKAVPLLIEAAEAGNSNAISELARFNYKGIGMERNKQKALELYDQAAKMDDLNAIDFLRRFYREGKDTAENKALETQYALMAANLVAKEPIDPKGEHKMRNAYYLMEAVWALHYIGGVDTKSHLPMDTVAFRFAKQAALLGSPSGMYYTGKYFQYGIGVAQSNVAAIAWFREAVANGSDQAQYGLTELTGEKPTYSPSDYRYYEEQKKLDKENPGRNLTKADLPGGYVSKSENDAYNAWWQKTYGQPNHTYKSTNSTFTWGTPKTSAQRDQDSYDKMHHEANQREKNYNEKWGR